MSLVPIIFSNCGIWFHFLTPHALIFLTLFPGCRLNSLRPAMSGYYICYLFCIFERVKLFYMVAVRGTYQNGQVKLDKKLHLLTR